MGTNSNNTETTVSKNFIEQIIEKDIESGKNNSRVHTRFPPEPNGYLHIGHAKSICLNFGLAKKYNGKCNLRFDDTNPEKEDVSYVDSIKSDIRWLGFDWEDREFYASDYFQQLYNWAVELIKKGKAYVCELSAEEVSKQRGTINTSGVESPYRKRSVNENLELLERMRQGEFPAESKILRAKIDMASPNMLLRDPVLYRINYHPHHRTGKKWCIYPIYDYAHGQSDSLEGITHSVCTLEFDIHRPLYDWLIKEIGIHHPQQIEFARLNLTYTIMSKRKLLTLVEQNYVSGWDDPRMPTISGLRRRGYTSLSIRTFAEKIGVAKRNNTIDLSLLEFCIREELNKTTNRYMAVLNPVKLIITNYPDNQTEEMDAVNNPEDESAGKRKIPFCKELLIERDDFMEEPSNKFFRLAPGKEVRLRYAYIIKCNDIAKNENGEIKEIYCTYDPESKSGVNPGGRKIKGTIHWVSAQHSELIEVKLYDRLFLSENPDDAGNGKDFTDNINPESLKTVTAYSEPEIKKQASATDEFRCQFERLGYFYKDSTENNLVLNRIVTLKDTWAKINKKIRYYSVTPTNYE